MPSPVRILAIASSLALSSFSLGCTAPGGEDDGDTTSGPPIEVDPLVIPTNSGDLQQWLQAEAYLDWPSESAIHDSTGPHFGNVRTWLHPELFASLENGASEHPVDVGTVKELYGDGMARRGWSVSVKIEEDSQAGDGWYWYELYDGGVLADAVGFAACTGCHGAGIDYVRTPFPLE